jgi:TRAP-type C4-dicarboxylate transport system permease small subunit
MQSLIRKGLAAIEELSAGLDRSDALRVANERGQFPSAEGGPRDIPGLLRLTAVVLRAVFLCVLVVIIVHISHPQSETIWTAHETPADAVRLALGIAASIFLILHIFIMPKDAEGYRIWLYLGLGAIPFALLFLIAVW